MTQSTALVPFTGMRTPLAPPPKRRSACSKGLAFKMGMIVLTLLAGGAYFLSGGNPTTPALATREISQKTTSPLPDSLNSPFSGITPDTNEAVLALDHPEFEDVLANAAEYEVDSFLENQGPEILDHPQFEAILARASPYSVGSFLVKMDIQIIDHPKFDTVLARARDIAIGSFLEKNIDHPRFDELLAKVSYSAADSLLGRMYYMVVGSPMDHPKFDAVFAKASSYGTGSFLKRMDSQFLDHPKFEQTLARASPYGVGAFLVEMGGQIIDHPKLDVVLANADHFSIGSFLSKIIDHPRFDEVLAKISSSTVDSLLWQMFYMTGGNFMDHPRFDAFLDKASSYGVVSLLNRMGDPANRVNPPFSHHPKFAALFAKVPNSVAGFKLAKIGGEILSSPNFDLILNGLSGSQVDDFITSSSDAIFTHPKTEAILAKSHSFKNLVGLPEKTKQEFYSLFTTYRPRETLFESALRFRKSKNLISALIPSYRLPAANALDSIKETPLSLLVRYGYATDPELVLSVLQSSPKLDPNYLADILSLLINTTEDYTSTLFRLIEEGYLNSDTSMRENNSEWNLLVYLTAHRRNDLLKALLKKSSLLTLYRNGLSPLHMAAITGNKEAYRLLLSFGANPLEKNQFGRAPVDYQDLSSHSPLEIKTLYQMLPISAQKSLFARLSPVVQMELPDLARSSDLIPTPKLLTQIEKKAQGSDQFSFLAEKYQKKRKELKEGKSVQIPLYARCLSLDLLQEYAREKRLIYKHRGASGLWFAPRRLKEYGPITLWLSSTAIATHPTCGFNFGLGFDNLSISNSIDISEVVQISSEPEHFDKIRSLLRENELNIPVVTHDEADMENVLVMDLINSNPNTIKDKHCSSDFRNH